MVGEGQLVHLLAGRKREVRNSPRARRFDRPIDPFKKGFQGPKFDTNFLAKFWADFWRIQ